MTREDAIKYIRFCMCEGRLVGNTKPIIDEKWQAGIMAIKALEQESCEMTAEDYRQRMIQAFHNADCDELIAVCVLPTEKEFEHLEWLLKNHYKKEPCEDAVSRTDVLELIEDINDTVFGQVVSKGVMNLPSVNPQKIGHWYVNEWGNITCSKCGCTALYDKVYPGESVFGKAIRVKTTFCPTCGARMVEPQESEDKE